MTAFFILGFVLLFGVAVLCIAYLAWWACVELRYLACRLFGGDR